ncbi:MAG: helix-turn-helix domain-containing protein [Cyanobacteriota bacterium]|nr:helix-turn-helix domain-containing protein [Cyanobacteriota bacterium]
MSGPPPGAKTLLRRPGRWLRRLWPPGLWPRTVASPPPAAAPPDPLRSAGRLLRERREAKGLRLRDLAQRTRISLAVLEALEGGWRDRLPEAAYLRTMLPLLEQELDLAAGTLEGVLPPARREERGAPSRQGLTAAVFSPFTIHFLTRWQGTVLYALLTLGLVYGVNLQQQRLAALGLLATHPVPLTRADDRGEAGERGARGTDLPAQAWSDGGQVGMLSRAAAGQAMALMGRESEAKNGDLTLGLLRLDLTAPTRVDLRAPRGGDWRLERLEGTMSLPVLPPFELRLRPAPPPGAVRWRGQPLRARGPGSAVGLYGVPPLP